MSSSMLHIGYMTDIINYTVRLDRKLKDRIKADAEKQGLSLNANLVRVYEQYLSGELVPVEEILTNPRSKKLIKKIIKECQ